MSEETNEYTKPPVSLTVGEMIPDFMVPTSGTGFDNLRTILSEKRVIIFAVPGAFTPTCSSTHLPGFEAKYQEFMDIGIDEIYCMSINDWYVMDAWFRDLGIENVKFLSDGAYTFASRANTWVLKDNAGMGSRSWRYALVVDNNIITHMFFEEGMTDNCPTDPFEVSSAENVYNTLTA